MSSSLPNRWRIPQQKMQLIGILLCKVEACTLHIGDTVIPLKAFRNLVLTRV